MFFSVRRRNRKADVTVEDADLRSRNRRRPIRNGLVHATVLPPLLVPLRLEPLLRQGDRERVVELRD